MRLRLSAVFVWGAVAALALAVAPLLTRNLLAISRHVPLDPNEGWNAAHTLALLAGKGLYPPPQGWMVNNYPPLSFYLVGAIARKSSDIIATGRAISFVAFLLTAVALGAAAKAMNCGARAIALAVLFLAAHLLINSNYVGMYDPQLLGHAIQLAALVLLLGQQRLAAALLFAVSLFIKHNLLALPLASALWLLVQDRRAGLQFLLWGLIFVSAGLIVLRYCFGIDLLTQLASARLYSPANLGSAISKLWWAALPLGAMTGLRLDRYGQFCAIYVAAGLILGLAFAVGDGVDVNVFFDFAIALSLALGLAADRGRWPILSAASALPLLIMLAVNFDDNNFFFGDDFASQSARDIAFLKTRPGPILCDQLSLCLWAGKKAEVDVFNIGEAIKAGARDPSPLARMIAQHHFAVLQLQNQDGLGPMVQRAIAQNYRLQHSDDNGQFLVPQVRPAP
jgi:hypothetical protein